MKVVILDRESLDLSQSLVEETYGYEVESKVVTVDGCLLLSDGGVIVTWVSDWLTQRMRDGSISVGTADQYAKSIKYFLEWLSLREVRYKRPKPKSDKHYQDLIVDATKDVILEYLNHNTSLSTKTLLSRDAALMGFYNEYVCCNADPYREPYLDPEYNPYKSGPIFKGRSYTNHHGAVSLDELMALMMVVESERERCLLQFMLDSGLRHAEVVRVTKSDVEKALTQYSSRKAYDVEQADYHDLNYYVFPVKGTKVHGRTGIKPRNTFVSKATLLRLRNYFNNFQFGYKKFTKGYDDPPAFLNSYGSPYTKAALKKFIERTVDKAMLIGLIDRKITIHKFRHGFSVQFLTSPDQYADPRERMIALSKCLGHSSPKTTEIHYSDIAVEIQTLKGTGELVTRWQKFENVYNKTKPANIDATRREYFSGT